MITLEQATQEFNQACSQLKQSKKDQEILRLLKVRIDKLNQQMNRINNEKELEPKHKRSLMIGYLVWAIADVRRLEIEGVY